MTSKSLLPADKFALASFGGWVRPKEMLSAELNLGPTGREILRFVLRNVASPTIASIAVVSVLP